MFTKKNRYRPLYKQFLKVRENVQNRKKLLKFKRLKWKQFIKQYRKKLRRYKKFKPFDQTRYLVSKFPNRGTSYKKRFRNSLNASKKFRLLYGGLTRKYLKKQIKYLLKKNITKKNLKNWNLLFIKQFENRLDNILYKSKFSISLRNARQLIVHGKVFVNNSAIKIPSYTVKQGDLISIDPKYYFLIEKNLKSVQIWTIPPKHLTINYKTLEIVVGNMDHINAASDLPFHLNLERIVLNYYQH
jgi:small subunit ribosomal protein S4